MRIVLRCFLAMENGMMKTAIVNELSFVRNHSVSVYVLDLYVITAFDLTLCILINSSFWLDTINLKVAQWLRGRVFKSRPRGLGFELDTINLKGAQWLRGRVF